MEEIRENFPETFYFSKEKRALASFNLLALTSDNLINFLFNSSFGTFGSIFSLSSGTYESLFSSFPGARLTF